MTAVDEPAVAASTAFRASDDASIANNRPVYLDYNATSPLAPEALEAMMPFLTVEHGNASSTHPYGVVARRAIEAARAQVAVLIGAEPEEVLFTSGGSESNNLALKGSLLAGETSQAHVLISCIEHPAVQNTCRHLSARFGCRVTTVPVDSQGMVRPSDVLDALQPETRMISVMLANNEVGTLQPLAEISQLLRDSRPEILIHTDAAQAVGKIPVDVRRLGVDLLTIAAHKLCGPKGVGALYVRSGVTLEPLIHGSGHERGRRAGTENVPGIVGLGAAAELACLTLGAEEPRLRRLRGRLQTGVCGAIPPAVIHGHPERCLPNTLNVSFPGVTGIAMLEASPGLAASTGSACHSASAEPSPVLLAMGVAPELASGAIRLSHGRYTTEADIDRAVDELAGASELLGVV